MNWREANEAVREAAFTVIGCAFAVLIVLAVGSVACDVLRGAIR